MSVRGSAVLCWDSFRSTFGSKLACERWYRPCLPSVPCPARQTHCRPTPARCRPRRRLKNCEGSPQLSLYLGLFRAGRSRVLARGYPDGKFGFIYVIGRAVPPLCYSGGQTSSCPPLSLSLFLSLSLAREHTHTLSLSHTHTAAAARRRPGRAGRSAVVCVCVCYSCRDGGPADDRRRTTWPIEDSPTVRFWVRGSLLCESRLIVMIRSGSPSLFCRSSGSMGSLFPTSSGPVACRGPEVSLFRRGEKRWRRTVDGPARTEDAGLHMQRRRKPVIERNESERSTAEPRHHLCASFSVLPPLAHRRTACHGSCGHQGTGAPHPERSDGDASSCVLFPALFLCTPRISTRTS